MINELVGGDQGVVVPVQLLTAAGPPDITGCTVSVHVRPANGGTVTTYTGTLTEPTAGKFVFVMPVVPAGPTQFEAEYSVTFPDTSQITWPSRRPDMLIVRAELA